MKAALLALVLCLTPTLAGAHTVKTNHTNVNLWSGPGRDIGQPVAKIKRFEEVQVLAKKRLRDGSVWYRVELRRLPGWRVDRKLGWVDSKFFVDLTQDSTAMETTIPNECIKCRPGLNSLRRNEKDIRDLSALLEREALKGKISSKGFLWPTTGTIRSGFGMRRHPITGIVKLHNGTDIAGNDQKPVLASKAGVIKVSRSGCRVGAKSCNGGAGNFVVIDHGNGTQTKYLHLSSACRLPPSGSRVTQGQKIACVGSTGASTGPHLHFGVVQNGNYINPLKVLPPRST